MYYRAAWHTHSTLTQGPFLSSFWHALNSWNLSWSALATYSIIAPVTLSVFLCSLGATGKQSKWEEVPVGHWWDTSLKKTSLTKSDWHLLCPVLILAPLVNLNKTDETLYICFCSFSSCSLIQNNHKKIIQNLCAKMPYIGPTQWGGLFK